MNKKGSITDAWFVVGMVFVTAIAAVLGLMVMNQLQAHPGLTEKLTAEGQQALQTTDDMIVAVDGILLFIFVGLIVVSLILAYFLPVHPIFIGVFVLMEVILIAFSPVVSNSYDTIMSNPELAVQANSFVYAGTIMDNLPVLMVAHISLLLIITFFKGGQPGVGVSANF